MGKKVSCYEFPGWCTLVPATWQVWLSDRGAQEHAIIQVLEGAKHVWKLDAVNHLAGAAVT